MNTSFRDVELISAFLDNECSREDKSRLEYRLSSEPELVSQLEDLRQVRSILRGTPQRRVPRNFTLTRNMAGIRPPVPRSVPVFSWASAVAILLFVFTLGGNLVGKLSFGASAPMMAEAPVAKNGVGAGPAGTESPAESSDRVYVTATPEISSFSLVVPPAEEATSQAVSQEKANPPKIPWLLVWPASAAIFISAAILIRGLNIRNFKRKTKAR